MLRESKAVTTDAVELSSMLQRCLFLKLYLERAVVIPLPDQLRSQCEQQYSEWFAALRSFTETGHGHAGFKLFTMFRGLTNEVRTYLD